MEEGTPSTTAMLAALARGRHRWFDPQPWVFDDPFAMLLVGEQWPQLAAMMTAVSSDAVTSEATAAHALRCRYVEDQLDLRVHGQYVVLGAGLDSFAWRRPDLLGLPLSDAVDAGTLARWVGFREQPWFDRLRVFEVDHPDTQAWKRGRVAALALPSYDGHVYVPVDFERTSLPEALTAAGLRWDVPTLFSWTGVTMYLTREAIMDTLRLVAQCAPGSAIAFTYVPVEAEQDDCGREYLGMMSSVAAATGEPFRSLLTGDEAEELVRSAGLAVVEHPTRDELAERYFAGRPDGLRPSTFERLLTAAPPG